jgi:hypothetical protein
MTGEIPHDAKYTGAIDLSCNGCGSERSNAAPTTRTTMTTVELKLSLPDQLAKEAQEAGLLSPEAIEGMVREELRAIRLRRFDQAREVLRAKPVPPMTAAEVQAEIDVYRAESRRAAGT